MRVLDLFSAAAGGWSLGLHRAGFETVAACEWIEWRRTLYAENNPGVLIYDDVRTLTGERLLADLGALPDVIVGSPPCQDISSANTKGKGVDGERSGLFFEAIRIIGEVRPRWVALENSANLRTRGADRVLGELEGQGYACWAVVVGGDTVGANHERKRSWIIGCDVEQLAAHSHDASKLRGTLNAKMGELQTLGDYRRRDAAADAPQVGRAPWAGDRQGVHAWGDGRLAGDDDGYGHDVHAPSLGHEGGRSRRHGPDGNCATSASESDDADASRKRQERLLGRHVRREGQVSERTDRPSRPEMGLRPSDRLAALQHRADWSLDDLARHIRLDDGLPAWLAEQRIAVGGPRGTSAASFIVEAYGDAVIPQITEAIGRSILRVEAAMAAVARPERIAA